MFQTQPHADVLYPRHLLDRTATRQPQTYRINHALDGPAPIILDPHQPIQMLNALFAAVPAISPATAQPRSALMVRNYFVYAMATLSR